MKRIAIAVASTAIMMSLLAVVLDRCFRASEIARLQRQVAEQEVSLKRKQLAESLSEAAKAMDFPVPVHDPVSPINQTQFPGLIQDKGFIKSLVCPPEHFALEGFGLRVTDPKPQPDWNEPKLVIGVKAGSPADKVGFRVGDRLHELDSKPIVLQQLSEWKFVEVVVFRDDKKVILVHNKN